MKVFAIVFFVLSFTSSCYAEDWQSVLKTETGEAFYDKDSVVKLGHKVALSIKHTTDYDALRARVNGANIGEESIDMKNSAVIDCSKLIYTEGDTYVQKKSGKLIVLKSDGREQEVISSNLYTPLAKLYCQESKPSKKSKK